MERRSFLRPAAFVMTLLLALPMLAQSGEDSSAPAQFDFGMGLDIGATSFQEEGEAVAYQKLILKPDLAFGKWGIGLWIPFHFRFTDDGYDFREEDWVLQDDEEFLEKYLPIFNYVRYGVKGDDLYAKFGSIEGATLGNGFIMGGYSNTLFLPDTRILGLSLDVDGNLVNFPYVGVETFVGNLALFDVVGARVYARPLAGTNLPLLPKLQVGTTYAADRVPDAQYDFYTDPDMVSIYGVDLRQPILEKELIDLAAFGDFVVQNDSTGTMVGAGGRLVKHILYGAQLRFLGEDFVPVYFDGQYDLYREAKYAIYNGDAGVDAYTGWYGSLGFAFFQDTVVFLTSLEGAFGEPENDIEYPHLNATFKVGEGLLPGIYFDATYDKRIIKEWEDLSRADNSVIGVGLNYKTGNAVISLSYLLRYDPEDPDANDSWVTTANLSTSVAF